MFKSFSEWIAKLARRAPVKPDPNGDELAALLFSMPDPIALLAPLGGGFGLPGPTRIGQPTRAQARSERRQKALDNTELFFVAMPDSMRALREAGHISKESNGREVAVQGSRRIPFFGYADVTMDDRHWGLELRRVGAPEMAAKERHALREEAAQEEGKGGPPPRARSPGLRGGRI